MGNQIFFQVKKPAWLQEPKQRWNAGLLLAGNAWKAENEAYPPKSGASLRTGTLGRKSNFRIIEMGALLELRSTFYWKYLMFGTGIYGPEGKPITPKNARFLAWQVKGSAGHLLVASGVRKRKGKFTHDPRRDVGLVFAKSVRGTIWAGKLEQIKNAMKDAFREGVQRGAS